MNFFTPIILLTLFYLAYIFLSNFNKKNLANKKYNSINISTDYFHSFQRRLLLSDNEKEAFHRIKEVTDELDLLLFTKPVLFL